MFLHKPLLEAHRKQGSFIVEGSDQKFEQYSDTVVVSIELNNEILVVDSNCEICLDRIRNATLFLNHFRDAQIGPT